MRPSARAKVADLTAFDHLGKDHLSYREGGAGGAEAGGAGASEWPMLGGSSGYHRMAGRLS